MSTLEIAPEKSTGAATLKAIEFYSGIGGWRHALDAARERLPPSLRHIEVVAAYDISPVANDVYTHNLTHTCAHTHMDTHTHTHTHAHTHSVKPDPRSIDTLCARELDAVGAQLWMMSPPCQPYTRNNTTDKRDRADPRSASLWHLCGVLRQMEQPPDHLVLENVQGFEVSECCREWVEVCVGRGYHVTQAILTPTQGFEVSECYREWIQVCVGRGYHVTLSKYQVGCPNERPRYFCMARRRHTGTGGCSPLLAALPTMPTVTDARSVGEYLDDDISPEELSSLMVPDETLVKSSSWCFDIVTPKSRRSSCFTKSYSRFTRGTGSIVYVAHTHTAHTHMEGDSNDDGEEQETVRLQLPEERSFDEGWYHKYRGKLRYFTPSEVARLLHFPLFFSFPPSTPNRKRYELLGNSIHVGVAAEVLVYLLTSDVETMDPLTP